MKCKMTGAAGLAGAFVAGMVVATAMGGGMAAAGAKTLRAAVQEQQVTGERVISPKGTDGDIALLRQDLRAMKMQVIGQDMSLSDTEAHKILPNCNHYVKELQGENNQEDAL